MYSSKHPIAMIGGWNPAVTIHSKPLFSSELVDAFCVIILLVFLCFNNFPSSSLDIFSWLIACFASHFTMISGGDTLPKWFAVTTLHFMSDPNGMKTLLWREERASTWVTSWLLALPLWIVNSWILGCFLSRTPTPTVSLALLHRTHCSPSSTQAKIPQLPLTLNEPHGEAIKIKQSRKTLGSFTGSYVTTSAISGAFH